MPSENLLKNSIITGIFLTPFVSLIVISSFFFPYITPKNLAFRLIALIIAALFAILMYRSKRYRPDFGTVGWSFVIFVLVLFFADLFGQYAHKSFFSNFERMEGFFTILLLFFYFTVLTAVMKTEKIWENLLNASLGSSVLMSIFAIVEKSHGTDRLTAQLGNATYLAAFMLFNIFFALFLIVRRLDRKSQDHSTKWLSLCAYLAVLVLDLYVFYYTGTRGALLGLFGGMMFTAVLFAFFEKHNRKLKIAGYTILIVVVVFVGSLYGLRNSSLVTSNPLLSRFGALIAAPTDLSSYASTQGKSRFSIWAIALKGVEQKPLLGWGQENFNYVFNAYYDPKIYDQEQWFDRAHNVFFDWLIAGGALGLLAYLSMFVFAIFTLWKKKREDETHHFTFADKTILTALLLAYFIHNFFVFDSITSYILFFTVLAYISIHERPLHWLANPRFAFIRNDGLQALGATAFVLGSVVGLYYLVISPYIGSTDLLAAISYQNNALSTSLSLTADQRNALLEQSLSLYEGSITHGLVGGAEANEQILQGATEVVNAEGISDDVKKAFANEADAELKKQLADTPADARYFLFYATYLANTGRYDESYPYFKKAEELSPNKQSILISEGLAYINGKQYGEAEPIFKKAFELDTDDTEARILYVVSLIYTNNDAMADTVLQPIRDTDDGTDLRIMKAYYDTNQVQKINDLLQIKLKIAEDLEAKGDKEGAIKEIQDVISISPTYQKQGQAMIDEIEGTSTPS